MADNKALVSLPLEEAIELYMPEYQAALPDDIPAQRFRRTVLTALNQNPDLAKCDRRSFFLATIRCAHDGLYPDGREAALIPFQGVVQYIPMVHGYRVRLEKTGKIDSVICEVVYQHDRFRRVMGEDYRIEHEPPDLGEERGEMRGAYAIIKLRTGGVYRDVMDRHEIEGIRDRFSKNTRADAPWVLHPGEMWRKTVLRRCAKQVPWGREDAAFTGWRDGEESHPYVPVPEQPLPPRPTTAEMTQGGPAKPSKVMEVKGDAGGSRPRPVKSNFLREKEPPAKPPAEPVAETYSFTDAVGEVFEFDAFADAVATYSEMLERAADQRETLIALWDNGEEMRAALERAGHREAVAALEQLMARLAEPKPEPAASVAIPFDGVSSQLWYKQARAKLEEMLKTEQSVDLFKAFREQNIDALKALHGPGPAAFRSLWEILDKQLKKGLAQENSLDTPL